MKPAVGFDNSDDRSMTWRHPAVQDKLSVRHKLKTKSLQCTVPERIAKLRIPFMPFAMDEWMENRVIVAMIVWAVQTRFTQYQP